MGMFQDFGNVAFRKQKPCRVLHNIEELWKMEPKSAFAICWRLQTNRLGNGGEALLAQRGVVAVHHLQPLPEG